MDVQELTGRVELAREHYRTKLAEMPDPGDEGVPNRRAELEAEQRRLRAAVGELHLAWNLLENLQRRLGPLAMWRSLLGGAVVRLGSKLTAAEERLDEARLANPDPREWRAEELEVEALSAAVSAAVNGWTSEASVAMRRTCVPEKLQAELPGIDWDTKAKPMAVTERMIADWQEQVDELAQRVRPYLVEAGVMEVDLAAA